LQTTHAYETLSAVFVLAVLPADAMVDFLSERRIISVKRAVFTPESRSPRNFGA
jgi:hypothetical protein